MINFVAAVKISTSMVNKRFNGLLIYILKCAVGTIAVFSISSLIHYTNIAWSLISVLLVISPEGKDAVSLAFNRIKANVVGAGVGLLCLLIITPNMWTLSLGIAITISLCYLLKLEAGVRSALAATVIIMLHQEGNHLWNTATERVIAVLAGCVLGLIITFLFHLPFKGKRENNVTEPETSGA
jgi:uncharacterized membrane protein YgaE (UPF0421/DUF939 family)